MEYQLLMYAHDARSLGENKQCRKQNRVFS